MAKKFRYSHLFTTKTGNQAITSAAEKLREAEIALAVADGEEKILFKNENEDVVAVPTDEQVDAKLANKTDYIVNGANGRALIFNETDGGGAKFEHNDGTWSFAGVNDGGANGLAAQVYAVDSQNGYKGTKLDVTVGGLYYTKGEESGKSLAQRDVEANEVATKGDISGISDYFDGVEYVSTAKTINFYHGNVLKDQIDATDFIKDGMIKEVKIDDVVIGGQTVRCLVIIWNTDAGDKETDIPLTDIFDPSNYYTKADTDALLASKTDTATTAALNDVVTAHTANTDIHVTTTQTAAWDAKLDASNIATLTPSEKVLTNGGNVEISITDLSTSGEADVDEDNEGNIILEAGEF